MEDSWSRPFSLRFCVRVDLWFFWLPSFRGFAHMESESVMHIMWLITLAFSAGSSAYGFYGEGRLQVGVDIPWLCLSSRSPRRNAIGPLGTACWPIGTTLKLSPISPTAPDLNDSFRVNTTPTSYLTSFIFDEMWNIVLLCLPGFIIQEVRIPPWADGSIDERPFVRGGLAEMA